MARRPSGFVAGFQKSLCLKSTGEADETSRVAGSCLKLTPGESVTLMPNEHWHAIWGGDVFVDEVSTVNDDNTDNVFEDPRIARFGGIDEDEEPWHLLVSDYKKWLG